MDDGAVRLHIYRTLASTGRAPSALETAAGLGLYQDEVEAAYSRLAAQRTLLLMPDSHEVRMAWPFSGVPTAFRVSGGGQSWFANCGWDLFGIAALLPGDSLLETECQDCGESLAVRITNGQVEGSGMIHFAVPVAKWWDDIAYT